MSRSTPNHPSASTTNLAAILLAVLPLCAGAAQDPDDEEPLAYLITLEGQPDAVAISGFVKRVQYARASGATHIIVDLDTDPAVRAEASIVGAGEALLEAREEGIRTLAWIPRRALGQGAVLALACGEIMMQSSASLGNAMPPDLGNLKGFNFTQPDQVVADILGHVDEWSGHDDFYPANLGKAMVDSYFEVSLVRTADGPEYWRAQDVANPQRPMRDQPRVVVTRGKVLQLNTEDALFHGMAQEQFRDLQGLLDYLDVEEAIELEPPQLEGLARIVSMPWVSVVLIALGCIGMFIEIKTPGFGLGGAVAIAAFGVLFFGHYISGLAEGWEIMLFIVGVILLAVEIFLIPGFGVAGALGIAAIMASLFLTTLPASGNWSFGDASFVGSLATLAVGLMLPILAGRFLLKVLPNTPMFSHLVLRENSPDAPPDMDAGGTVLSTLAGRGGVAVTVLRPAGRVRIDGDEYDAMSTGDLIEAGERIVVTEVVGNAVHVRQARADEPESAGGAGDTAAASSEAGSEAGTGTGTATNEARA